MTTSTERPISAVSTWQLEYARLIAFPVAPPFFMDQHWWQEVAGGEPEDFISTRMKHHRQDRGAFRGNLLTLLTNLTQIQWIIHSSADNSAASDGRPILGPYRESIDHFVELISPWLSRCCPPLVRLAFAARLVLPAASQAEAYQVLSAHLPRVNLNPQPNDFRCQINRRKRSSIITTLDVNRVSAWSKENVAISLETPAGTPFEWPESCYSVLELDINTAPENTEELPPRSLPALLRELAAMGLDIAEQGDTV